MSVGLSHFFWRHTRYANSDRAPSPPAASARTYQRDHNPGFVYEPLDKSTPSSFRLVELLPGEKDSTIHCRLLVDSWDADGSPYEALSYVWGHDPYEKCIQLNSYDFHVTPNLHSALVALRNEISEPKRIWIDSICIDQGNVVEKNDQVASMGSIYARSTQVLIWLGDEDDTTKDAIEFLHGIQSKLPILSSLSNEALRALWRSTSLDSTTLDEIIRADFAPRWCAVARIFQRKWWIRAWVFQEFVKAPKLCYQIGSVNFHGGLLLMAVWIIYHHSGNFQCIIDLVPEFESLRERMVLSGYEINQTRLNNIFNESNTNFAYLLGCQRLKECSDARDRVYSILSLTSSPIRGILIPDYSRSVQHIFTSAVKAYTLIYEDLDILAYSMHGSSSETIPSWCPDWTLPRSRLTLGGPVTTRGFAASGNQPAFARFSEDLNILWVKGFRIDEVKAVELQKTSAEFFWDKTREGIEASWDFQRIAQELANTEGFFSSALDNDPDDHIGVLKDVKSRRKSQKISIIKTLIATLAAGDVPTVDEKWASSARKALDPSEKQIQEPIIHYDATTDQYWPSDVEGFYELLCHKTWGRTLILSSNARLGLAPRDTKIGDELFILWGFKTPAVLRKRADGTYSWIGDAYIHEIMCGEAIVEFGKETHTEEVIALQ